MDRWKAKYEYSSTGTRANSILEPTDENMRSWARQFSTEEEAKKYFSEELDGHVKTIIRNIKYYSNNNALKKRLKKYGNTEGLEALDKVDQLLRAMPNF